MNEPNFELYNCKSCNFTTNRKFNYEQHLETQKHKENAEFKCNTCNNYYKYKQK